MAALQHTSLIFIPFVLPVVAHACCAVCDAQCPADTLASIESDEVYGLYTQDYSLERDDLICPDCLKAINVDYQPRSDCFNILDALYGIKA